MPDIFVAPKKTKTPAPQKQDVFAEKVAENTNGKPVIQIPLENHNPVHLFTSFCKNPVGLSFQNQDENEDVLLFIRKHMITNFRWVAMGIFFVALPFLIIIASPFLGIKLTFLPYRFILLFGLFYYLLVATYFFVNFITWYFNISLVTDQRVIDVDFSSLVYKNVAATKLTLVQDVSYTQIGVVRSIFDYGDVLVQTAGTLDNFDFEAAPQPENVVHIIEDLIGKEENV